MQYPRELFKKQNKTKTPGLTQLESSGTVTRYVSIFLIVICISGRKHYGCMLGVLAFAPPLSMG